MQPIQALRTNLKIYCSFIFTTSVLVLFLPISIVLAADEDQTGNTGGLQVLSQQKKEMEQQAFILVGLLESKDITQEEYATGQTLYGKAKTDLDKWITQIQKALQEGKDAESSEAYQAALQDAANTSEEFRKYVHKKFLGNPRGEVARKTRNIIKIFQDASSKILMELKGKDSSQDLEEKKLAKFSQVEAKK